MCVVSAVIDTWRDDWGKRYPFAPVPPIGPFQPYDPEQVKEKMEKLITDQERAKLKKEIEEFRAILKRARAWDKEHQVEDCDETPQKIEALRELVRQLGLEDEVEIVLKEIEEDKDPDSDYFFTPPIDSTTIIRAGSSSGTNGTGYGISVGGPGYYDDPSA